ncbi:prenyltransferase/squalene oxidase repeat-containing protein [Crateriforma spongiae]|uniref:prenyltransferase/squalene oxidase repeat-containing protein n=1 Tax=Crateriforma spongiae TaxID=2724528 RepID=UPI00144873BA|nr:prenyltransferase/squalene oxidase repeat-containing protein [Crateriforma spongiae]
MSSPDPIAADAVTTLRRQARATLDTLRDQLMQDRGMQSHWTGTLSPSALGTATAVSAMSALLMDRQNQSLDATGPLFGLQHVAPEMTAANVTESIERGIAYLATQQNSDGGFGDTDRSLSNIATSYLVLAASELAAQALGPGNGLSSGVLKGLQGYIDRTGGLDALRRRYGKDKTFVVPIMTNLAIAGLLDWGHIPALPFEAAVFPQSMYRFLQVPVVSYAVPALVAMGQARFLLGPKPLPPVRWIRSASVDRTMEVLRDMQPESGGYLEATPLTAFVVMSLAATGRSNVTVARQGLLFLLRSMTDEGSWPIDTNLATWVTSLSVLALSTDDSDDQRWCDEAWVDWHLACQHRKRHPFTGAEPGGWGWTDLSGAVPDSDDTPAAILALCRARESVALAKQQDIDRAVMDGVLWLIRLQNRNGGWPTFCRGWGKLPFDRSSTDLTAHAIRALQAAVATGSIRDENLIRAIDAAVAFGFRFLRRQHRDDGSWTPLWFGNQDRDDEENPVYGTARVLVCIADQWKRQSEQAAEPNRPTTPRMGLKELTSMLAKGTRWLIDHQNADGGWGGGKSVGRYNATDWNHRGDGRSVRRDVTDSTVPGAVESSVEETAQAVEALGRVLMQTAEIGQDGEPRQSAGIDRKACLAAITRGAGFLVDRWRADTTPEPWPIGFYFAKLWYHERLYPIVFSIAALATFLRSIAPDSSEMGRKPG